MPMLNVLQRIITRISYYLQVKVKFHIYCETYDYFESIGWHMRNEFFEFLKIVELVNS